jgi:phosphatidylserine synthase
MAKMGKVTKHIPNSMTLFNVIVGLSAIFFSMARGNIHKGMERPTSRQVH